MELHTKFGSEINKLVFKEPNIEWLEFVVFNRLNRVTMHKYDIVYGPTADAHTAVIIDRYASGEFGNPNRLDVKRKLLRYIKPKVYPRQVCLCSKIALNYASIIDIKHILN